ncbi:developmentally-regulated protein [Acrasis kona]|uniref:Developmentally-regulated protein n=1 Tax=Acrasis kona TaxID=1008807 RepID=A0AAW2ZGB8_9EUKA
MFEDLDEVENSLDGLVFHVAKDVPSRLKLMKRIKSYGGQVSKANEPYHYGIGTGVTQYHPDLVSYLTRVINCREQNLIDGFKAPMYRNSKPFNSWTSFDLKYRDINVHLVSHELFNMSLSDPSRIMTHGELDDKKIEEGCNAIIDQYGALNKKGLYHHGSQSGQESQHKYFCTVLSDQFKSLLDEHYQGLRYYNETVIACKDKFYGHGKLDISTNPQCKWSINSPHPILFFVECKSVFDKRKYLAQAVAELMAVNWTNQSYEEPEEKFPPCHALLTDGLHCMFLMIHNVTVEAVFVGVTEVLQIGTFTESPTHGQVFEPSENLFTVMQIMYVLANPQIENPGVALYRKTEMEARVLKDTIRQKEREAAIMRNIIRQKDQRIAELEAVMPRNRPHMVTEERRRNNKEGYFRSALSFIAKKLSGG